MIVRPLIGAVIGYITNWIAVKMMFRPLHPIYIGKWKVPFTPGIIPQNRGRIARAIGNAISENLLTEQVLSESLLSDEIIQIINEKTNNQIKAWKENNDTLESCLEHLMEKTSYDLLMAMLIDTLTDTIYQTIKEQDFGEIVARQLEKSAEEKISGSLLGMLGGNAIISKIAETSKEKVNEYIKLQGRDLIENMVEKEITKGMHTSIAEVTQKLEKTEIDVASVMVKIYRKIVMEKLADVLKTLNISKIVADKIEKMDMLELEKMILEVMKKELNALVNLGAIIGFILGLFNLLF